MHARCMASRASGHNMPVKLGNLWLHALNAPPQRAASQRQGCHLIWCHDSPPSTPFLNTLRVHLPLSQHGLLTEHMEERFKLCSKHHRGPSCPGHVAEDACSLHSPQGCPHKCLNMGLVIGVFAHV
jgi:hypothetical protein